MVVNRAVYLEPFQDPRRKCEPVISLVISWLLLYTVCLTVVWSTIDYVLIGLKLE